MYQSIELQQEYSHADTVSSQSDRESTSSALHRAISHGELVVEYQPRYDVDTGRTSMIEALVRWNKPGVGLVYPCSFIDEAIGNGLIFELDSGYSHNAVKISSGCANTMMNGYESLSISR